MLLPFSDALVVTNGFDAEMSMLADRHYSRRTPGARQFMYSGCKIVIRDCAGTVLFGWIFPDETMRMDGQRGYCCSIFRNESAACSSELILEAEQIAVRRWEPNRAFTYVNPRKLRTIKRHGREFCRWPPGRCFLEAGWKLVGLSKRGLYLFEKELGNVS